MPLIVERISESANPIESEKSKWSFGVHPSSNSPPTLRAFGTLKMRRDEQEPAVTVTCRSVTSM